ncbi:MAG: hypothetical protein J6386_11950 [Candidatus Synoicihabitans palmerolidicus]|nr:hypothetical protein [Candidatus Synoicihabitans palmerolidicus]
MGGAGAHRAGLVGWSRRGLGVLGLFVFSMTEAAKPVRMGGADLLGGPVVQALEARAQSNEEEIRVEFRGSRPAVDSLGVGNLDIAVLIEDSSAPELGKDFASVTLGYLTAVVVVPTGVPVDQVDFADLRQVYGAFSAVPTTRWGDFGATGLWSGMPISPHVTSPAERLSYVLFEHEVLPEGGLRNEVRMHDTLQETLKAVLADDGGMGVVPWLPKASARLKVLLVAPEPGQVAFGPTPDNLHAGDYPLRRAVHLTFRRAEVPRLLPWLRYWYGDEMSAAMLGSGVVPLPRSARNQQVFDLEVIE